MIPVLLDDGCEPRLPRSMIFMRDPKILLNLVPDLRDPLVPLNLRFCKGSIDLILPHNANMHPAHVQKDLVRFITKRYGNNTS